VFDLSLLLLLDEYWSNSQYCLHLQAPDRSVFARRSDDDNKCEVVVSLMQKNARRNRTLYRVQSADIAMTYDVYEVIHFACDSFTLQFCSISQLHHSFVH